jgi:hypothetical protein
MTTLPVSRRNDHPVTTGGPRFPRSRLPMLLVTAISLIYGIGRAGSMNMRQLTVALASACIFIASCSRTIRAPHPARRRPRPSPVAVGVLYGLLLSPAEIDTAIGATRIAVNETSTDLFDDSATIPDKGLPIQRPRGGLGL